MQTQSNFIYSLLILNIKLGEMINVSVLYTCIPAHFNNTVILLITLIILVTIIVIRNFYTVTSQVRIINLCCSQSWISAVIQKHVEKSYWVYVERTRVMWTYGFVYKNASSLHHMVRIFRNDGCFVVLSLTGRKRHSSTSEEELCHKHNKKARGIDEAGKCMMAVMPRYSIYPDYMLTGVLVCLQTVTCRPRLRLRTWRTSSWCRWPNAWGGSGRWWPSAVWVSASRTWRRWRPPRRAWPCWSSTCWSAGDAVSPREKREFRISTNVWKTTMTCRMRSLLCWTVSLDGIWCVSSSRRDGLG